MKKILYTLCLITACTISYAQGINFDVANIDEATAKAKAEKKLIFVDAYTVWCGPCKIMAKNVFTDPAVGEYFNKYFVNLKIDMEKGDGPRLAQAWEIQGYPTLIFLDSNGDVIHRSMGARPADDFVDLGHAANDPDRQITTMDKRYEAGERSADFLKKYVDAMTSSGMKGFAEVAQLYMKTQDDWSTPENISFIFDYGDASYDDDLFQYSLQHKQETIAQVGQERWDQKVDYAAEQDRTENGISRADIDALRIHYGMYYDETRAEHKAQMTYFRQLMYSQAKTDNERFLAEIQLFLAAEPALGWNFYNATAWQVYELSDDRDLLQKASYWSQISIAAEENSFNTDTQAHIQERLGDKKQARKFAMRSIELAKVEGSDPSATQKLLERL